MCSTYGDGLGTGGFGITIWYVPAFLPCYIVLAAGVRHFKTWK